MKHSHAWRWLVFLAVFSLTLGGCAPAKFQEPLGKYQQSVAKSMTVIEGYYGTLNQSARQTYLVEILYNPSKEVLRKDNGVPTNLVYSQFDPAAIKVRLDLVNALGAFGQKLAELAASNAPQRTGQALTALGGQFASLSDTINAQGGIDSSISSYAGPVSAIVGLCAKVGLQAAKDKAVADFIKDAYPLVDGILAALKSDLELIGPVYSRMLDTQLTQMVNDYNRTRVQASFEQRKQRLELIDLKAQEYVSSVLNPPGNVIESIKKSYDALYKYAQEYRKVDSLERLVAEMNAQADFLEQFAEQVSKIKLLNAQRMQ